MGGCSAGTSPWGARGVSAGRFFRASARRASQLPPLWTGGRAGGAMTSCAFYEMPAPEREMADARSGRDGSAPEGTSGAGVDHSGDAPANADQSWTEYASPAALSPGAAGALEPVPSPLPSQAAPVRASRLRSAERLALPCSSLMEDAAAQWATGAAPVAPADLPVIADEHGKAWCERCDARVPTWFATDCISGSCSLRAAGFGGAARDGADL